MERCEPRSGRGGCRAGGTARESRDYRMGSPASAHGASVARRQRRTRRRKTSCSVGSTRTSSATSSADGGCKIRHHDRQSFRPRARRARRAPSLRARGRTRRSRRVAVPPRRRCRERAFRARPRRRRRRRESARAARCARACSRARSRRVDVATARGIAFGLEPAEQFADAGLQRQPFALDDAVVGGMPAAEQRVDRIRRGVVRAEHGRAIGEVASDHRVARATCRSPHPAPPPPRSMRAPPAARCRAGVRPCRR